MKIAHLIQQLNGCGGLQVCVHNICDRHSKKGIDVSVFCSDAGNHKVERCYKVYNFFPFRAITQLYPLSKLVITAYVKRIQEKHHFDLWQIDGGYPYGALLADYFTRNKIPCVLRCCGDDIQINHELDYGVRRNEKINKIIVNNYKKFSASVAITETVKQEYIKLNIPEKTIRLIPNGVDITRLRAEAEENIRIRHNIPNKSTIILSVGRNHPKKGYKMIPGILEEVLTQNIDAYWIVIGRGCSEIKNVDTFASLRDRIILIEEIGSVTNSYKMPPDGLLHYYKGADLFAMTSLLETFGIVIIEALAAGLPTVCFNAPGVRDVMTPECGSICPVGDIKAFAKAIVQLATKEDRMTIRDHCFTYSEAFSWDRIADKYLELYTDL